MRWMMLIVLALMIGSLATAAWFVGHRPAAVAASSSSEIRIDDVNALARSIADAARREEEGSIEAGEQRRSPTSSKTEQSSSVSLLSTDIKRSESLVYPVVGEIVLSVSRISDSKAGFWSQKQERWTILVGRSKGSWEAYKARGRIEINEGGPNPPDGLPVGSEFDMTYRANSLLQELGWSVDQFKAQILQDDATRDSSPGNHG